MAMSRLPGAGDGCDIAGVGALVVVLGAAAAAAVGAEGGARGGAALDGSTTPPGTWATTVEPGVTTPGGMLPGDCMVATGATLWNSTELRGGGGRAWLGGGCNVRCGPE